MCKRIVLVGDSACGKTTLAMKVSANLFNEFYQPTSFENYQAEIPTNKGRCQITIMDTSGLHADTHLRELAYRDCDAVIVCFDLTDESTLESVEKVWIPEVQQFCPQAPVYIVGCKRDAMCEKECRCRESCCTKTEEELLEIVRKTGAVAYLECSSADTYEDGVEDLFKYVAESSGKKKKSILSSFKKRSKQLKRRLSIHL